MINRAARRVARKEIRLIFSLRIGIFACSVFDKYLRSRFCLGYP